MVLGSFWNFGVFKSCFFPRSGVFVSSLLIALEKPPFRLTFLAWVCLIPWMVELHHFFLKNPLQVKKKQALILFFQGFWLSFLESSFSYFWLPSAIQEFFGFGLLKSWFFFQVACSFLLEPQYPFVALALWLLHKKTKTSLWVHSPFVFPLVYTLIDSYVPKLFQFTLSYHLPDFLVLKQLSEIGGPFLITFFILLFQSILFIILYRTFLAQGELPPFRDKKIPFFCSIPLALACLVLAFLFGHWRLYTVQKEISIQSKDLHVAVIQSNIGNIQKLAAEKGAQEAAFSSLNTLLQLSKTALVHSPPPEIIFWPETAFPTSFTKFKTPIDFLLQNHLRLHAHAFRTPLLFGSFEEGDAGHLRNVAHLLQMNPAYPLQTYTKTYLFPFVERLPFLLSFDFMKKNLPQWRTFSAGEGPQLFSFTTSEGEVRRMEPLICYDSLFRKHTHTDPKAPQTKPHFLVLITNDSWFGPWAAELHLNISSFRSVETRLPLVSVANTGLSALVLPDGSITQKSHYGEQAVLHLRVPIVN